MSELVSIIMPSHNSANFISDSIRSVLEQTYGNWELIVVDDCSTDNTDEIVSRFHDPRIRYLKNKKNVGAAISRNRALAESRGEYIAFLDSDDLWKREKLQKQLEFMKENGYPFSYSNYEKIDERGIKMNVLCTGPSIVTKRKMYQYCYLGCLTVMFEKKRFEPLQIKDIKKNNDYAMWLALCKSHSCYLLNENLASYRIRKNSISHDKFNKKIKSHYDLFRVCDGRSSLLSFWLACRNMWYGFWKKIIYEKRSKH